MFLDCLSEETVDRNFSFLVGKLHQSDILTFSVRTVLCFLCWNMIDFGRNSSSRSSSHRTDHHRHYRSIVTCSSFHEILNMDHNVRNCSPNLSNINYYS